MRRDNHSIVTPANRTTFAHFSISATTNCPNSPGDIGIGSAPRLANFATIPGSARAAPISLLSLSMISAGVFFGAPIPCQTSAS